MQLENQNIAIIGGGESGVGAALLAKKMGAKVFVSDGGQLQDKYRSELQKQGIDFEESSHDIKRFSNAKWVVKSPGIPSSAPIIQKLRELD